MSFSDLYPERRGGKVNPTVFQNVLDSGPAKWKKDCEKNVINNIENAPMIRHMMSALKSIGCPLDISKQISCEMCERGTSLSHYGGYDEKYNQMFICANNCKSAGETHGLLLWNLIYMFDRCSSKYDFNNPDHLACTEIRKANLANCNFRDFLETDGASFGIKKKHAECVKLRALQSLTQTRFVPLELAKQSIEKVFDRCYKDLEPIGRRCRNVDDMYTANEEKFLYGYHL